MASSILGKLDIHSGGIDLVFPHHNNEIVQANSVNLMKDIHLIINKTFSYMKQYYKKTLVVDVRNYKRFFVIS